MRFIGTRELRSKGRKQWRALRSDEEAVLTLNGAPIAVLVGVPDGRLEDTLRLLRRARAPGAAGRMRKQAPRVA